ncbi:MAG: DUF3108 domain-containing protein [Betaproteobacteria bacterium]|nr:DUF3108 domain-containing protein [Betaproteobacteria bacterium]
MSPTRPGGPSRAALPARSRWRAAWWLLPVLVLHLAALWGLGRAFRPTLPHALPPALYTRVLLPQAPQPVAPEAASGRGAPSAPAHAGESQLLQAPVPSPTRETRPEPKATPPTPSQAASGPPPRAPAAAASKPPEPAPAEPTPAAASAPPVASTQAHAPAHAAAPASTPASTPPSTPASTPGSGADTASSASAGTVEAWPLPTRLDYALTGYYRGPLHGNGELEWRRLGQRYELRLSGSALIDFSYTSTGRIQGDWLAPDDYVEQVLLRRKTVHFDRAAGLLRFSAIGSTLPIPAHLLDSASVFMQLAQDLRTHPGRFQPGEHLLFQVARPSGTTHWDFLVAGTTQVRTRLGPLQAWHLVFEPPARDDLGAEVWLAPSLQDLPVQIRLRHGSDGYLLFTLRRALQQASPQASAAR